MYNIIKNELNTIIGSDFKTDIKTTNDTVITATNGAKVNGINVTQYSKESIEREVVVKLSAAI